jgi:NitT/TauT family transport system substrate-binding protein
MDCCQPASADHVASGHGRPVPAGEAISRRAVLKGLGASLGAVALAGCGLFRDDADPIRLAFCSQLLCVIPYEVTDAAGHFADQGLDVQLIYSDGGGEALQALQGGAVDYAATSFDAAVQAIAAGADLVRFASTGRLPLFALGTSPALADEIVELADLAGRTVGVSGLGNADHSLMLLLLDRAGVDPGDVNFATIGTNIYDVVRVGDVDAAWVQEPALTLLREDGGNILFNAMDLDDAEEHLGGPYEFMGVALRRAEAEERRDEARRLTVALGNGLTTLREWDPADVVDALPPELVAGQDHAQLVDTVVRYRDSLWPTETDIDREAAERAMDSLVISGALDAPLDLDDILRGDLVEGA